MSQSTLREYSIIESGFELTVNPYSDSLGKPNGLLAVNKQQRCNPIPKTISDTSPSLEWEGVCNLTNLCKIPSVWDYVIWFKVLN